MKERVTSAFQKYVDDGEISGAVYGVVGGMGSVYSLEFEKLVSGLKSIPTNKSQEK